MRLKFNPGNNQCWQYWDLEMKVKAQASLVAFVSISVRPTIISQDQNCKELVSGR